MFASEADDDLPIRDRKYEAWAIWNNCQGVFTCSVRHRRSECVEILKDYPQGKIVPVTIIVDPPEEWWRRHAYEQG
jgi:hypothetical protein